ncbi:MAG TPA: ArsA-related P-loop ATPase [Acidimicrobiales bacterium]|nr:ArsA-related P-loop ATPase [Acidimicrobiales bacterium]
MSIRELVSGASIVVCCGSGGVGKTTTAAALAVEAARLGRRACVVTIDPAKRLADALGLESLTNMPGRVEGPWSGELWAVMLDTKSTFDALVTQYADTPAQAERILANRLYRNISGALSGTQEYMAMEKLFELHQAAGVGDAPAYDLIVVDTPPTRNALDFIDAPRRLTKFLDNRLFRLLVMPSRTYLRAVSVATQAFLRTVARVVGAEVVDDAVAFFQSFEGMEQGFRERAQRVLELLADDATVFVLVASPRRDTVEEALYFADRLIEAGIGVDGLVVNRMHPRFGAVTGSAAADRSRAETLASTPLGGLFANLADFRQVAEHEEEHLAELAERVAPAPVARVPFLDHDVHDLDGLGEVAAALMAAADS